jgi:alpha-ketoglutarate-dependent taurine dioxygenase
MLTPICAGDQEKSTLEATQSWIKENRSSLQERLLRDGALLFRGFPVQNQKGFYSFLDLFIEPHEKLLDYTAGITPRKKVDKKIYTSTSAPAFVKILLHPEMCYVKNFPSKICFYCDQPSTQGGETPLADARQILKEIPADIIKIFEDKRIIYHRHMLYLSSLRKLFGKALSSINVSTWNYAFETDNKEEVEVACKKFGLSYTWNNDRSLTTEARVNAIQKHPKTDEKVWFNTIHFFIHEKYMFGNFLGPIFRVFRKLTGEKFEVFFGDGKVISPSIKKRVLEIIDKNTWTFQWQKGDVLIIDNYLCMHGRNPYAGHRKIYAGLIGKS